MKTRILLILTLDLVVAASSRAAAPDSIWTKEFGNNYCLAAWFKGTALIETREGNIAVGYSQDISNRHVVLRVMKPSGDLLWEKKYGGTGYYYCTSLHQLKTDGFLITGYVQEIIDNRMNDPDFWILETNAKGDSLWSTTYKSSGSDVCLASIKTSDGGYLLVGSTLDNPKGDQNFQVMRLNAKYDTIWTHRYGGAYDDYCAATGQTEDGGFLLVGTTESFGSGGRDFWVIKIDSKGDSLWSKTYGGINNDVCNTFAFTGDGGFILAGSGQVQYGKSPKMQLIRANECGAQLWSYTFRDAASSNCNAVINTDDHGFLLAGEGLIKTDIWGLEEWSDIYSPASNRAIFRNMIRTSDGGYILLNAHSKVGGYIKLLKTKPLNATVLPMNKSGERLQLRPGHGAVLFLLYGDDPFRKNSDSTKTVLRVDQSNPYFNLGEEEAYYFRDLGALLVLNVPLSNQFFRNWGVVINDLRVKPGFAVVHGIDFPQRNSSFKLQNVTMPPQLNGYIPFPAMSIDQVENFLKKTLARE